MSIDATSTGALGPMVGLTESKPTAPAADAPAPKAPAPAPAVPELAPSSAPKDADQGAKNISEPPAGDAPSAPAEPEAPAAEPAPKADKPASDEAKADEAKPNLAEEVTAENAEKVGTPTSNDGRADQLNTDEFIGDRRKQIEQLDQTREATIKEKEKITEAIDTLGDDVEGKERRSSIVDRVAKSIPGAGNVMGAIDGVANLLGKDFDPVEDIANNVQNTEEARRQLQELEASKEADIRRMDERIETLQGELDEAVVYNFLTNTAHTTSMGEATTRFMDGQGEVDIEVASAEEMPDGDGAYNPNTKTIQLSEATMQETQQSMEALRDKGIVDENGNIVDAAAFDADHEHADTAIGTVSLIAAHELRHQQDDATGMDDAAVDLSLRIAEGTWDGTGAGPIDPKLVDAASVVAAETGVQSAGINYALEEIQTYRQQEASDLQAGRERKVLLTSNLDGSVLPEYEAVHNLVSAFIGAPLQYGPNAGQVAPGRAYGDVNSQVGDIQGAPSESDPGRSARYGETDPGRSARYGEADPGRSARYGEADPGRSARYGEADPGRSARYGESDPGRSARY